MVDSVIKKTYAYLEANQEDRQAYLLKLKDIPRENLVYIDESGVDVNIDKEKGWALKGSKLLGKKSGKSYQRINILSGLSNGKKLAPYLFNGCCNTEIFNDWLENHLLKELKPGQVVVVDNATFHKSTKTQTLIQQAKCKLIFLPAYSPDLNPIEKLWANMKRWIKQYRALFNGVRVAIYAFFV